MVPQLVRIKKMLLRLASAMELPANPLDQVHVAEVWRFAVNMPATELGAQG